jgi:translation initiation factor 4E
MLKIFGGNYRIFIRYERAHVIDTYSLYDSSWSNVVRATRLDVGSNCFVFKQGIRPEWEDPINENGGKFSIQFQRTKQMGEAVNQLWLYAVSAVKSSIDFELSKWN